MSELSTRLQRTFDLRAGELRRVALMASILGLLLAANNVIKIVRDALFLSRFPIVELPNVLLLAALVAGVVIAAYARYSARVELTRIMRASMLFMIASVILFWLLIVFHGAGWVLYAYYVWSSIAGLVLVSQFWILAAGMFNARTGKRLFGIITAGGTLGAMIGGFASQWAVTDFMRSEHLLWLVIALIGAALALTGVALKARVEDVKPARVPPSSAATLPDSSGAIATVLASPYLKTIAALIFVSVIVSTLIDYQFKAAAKAAYPSADQLAGFFGSYYAWLGAVTMLAQLWLTGKVLTRVGLTPSLVVLPAVLMAGSVGVLVWPGLLAATATRMAEATLRTSVNQSGVQILYLPIADAVKKKVKVLLDVAVERLGDGAAAIIILLSTVALGAGNFSYLSYVAIALLVVWIVLVLSARTGYIDALRKSLAFRDVSLDTVRFDFADKRTLEAVSKSLDDKDEASVLFALELGEKLGSEAVVAHWQRLPDLLRHESPDVRRRALTLVASSLAPNPLAMIVGLLTADDQGVRAEAARTLGAYLEASAVPAVWPGPQGADALQQTGRLAAMLRSVDETNRQQALRDVSARIADDSLDGEPRRIETLRFMGRFVEPEFAAHLIALIASDPSPAAIREAMAAAAQGKYQSVVPSIIARLADNTTKAAAREALVAYGEMAVKALRSALFDDRVPREVRLNVPATLSKIHSQAAMNALIAGLLEEDRSVRFKAILSVAEMSRRFDDLKIDREVVESAILSDARLYCHRLVMYSALFAASADAAHDQRSLLSHALRESIDRVLEREMWLLALIYPAKDVRRVWSGLHSADARQRANATEFFDNLLSGDIKTYMSPLFSDDQPERRLRAALAVLRLDAIDAEAALRALLSQADRWLTVATVWEIGIRRLRGFRDRIAALARSDDPVVRETAALVLPNVE